MTTMKSQMPSPGDGVTHTEAELREMVQKMKHASNAFYVAAVHTGNHAFIEFTGFMNEYIKVCERMVSTGKDFTQCTAHTGTSLDMKAYEAMYIAEKFECIFGPTFRNDLGLFRTFAVRVMGDDPGND